MATVAARKTNTSLRSERIFYLGMMAALVALDVWGFARSFYFRALLTPPATYLDRPDWIRWAFMIHGTLFSCWIALFATQTVLIGSKRLPLHKQIGQAIYPLYFAILAYGLFIGWIGAKHGFHDIPFADSVTFSAIPLLVILAFALLAWLGLNERRDPQRHKRLMLLATIILSDAGIGRVSLFHTFLPPWFSPTIFMVVPLIVWDLATIGRIHRTTLFGSLLVVGVLLLDLPIGMTRPWHMVIETLIGGPGVPAGHIV